MSLNANTKFVTSLLVYSRAAGIDGGDDISREMLVGIYDRMSQTPFKPAADHVTQVMKVEQMIVGKKPVSVVWFHFHFHWRRVS